LHIHNIFIPHTASPSSSDSFYVCTKKIDLGIGYIRAVEARIRTLKRQRLARNLLFPMVDPYEGCMPEFQLELGDK